MIDDILSPRLIEQPLALEQFHQCGIERLNITTGNLWRDTDDFCLIGVACRRTSANELSQQAGALPNCAMLRKKKSIRVLS